MKKNISRFIALFICVFIANANISNAQTYPWSPLGPVLFPTNNSGQINGMGRTTQLKFHATNPAIIYATSASGGLWKSTDTGHYWNVLGTDTFARTKLASVCINYLNDKTIYLGTGDPNYYSTSSGIWKSVDGGVSWFLSNTNIGNRMAVEIIMSKQDTNVLVAATNNGIWKSTNAGATWVQKATGAFLDMKQKPHAASVTLYATTATQFYYSNDFGETWTLTSSGITILPDLGDGPGSRIAVTPADSNQVYLLMLNNGGALFKSNNSGVDFSVLRNNPDTNIVGYDYDQSGQGDYNMSFCVSPTDTNEIYVNCHCIWRSLSNGKYFKRLTHWSKIVHTDMHCSVFSPFFPSWQYNANDGGIWISKDSGISWKSINDGYGTTEFYQAAQSPTRNYIIGGTQDNGGIYYHNGSWYTYQGGDVTTRFFIDRTNHHMEYQCENGFRRSNLFGGYDSTYLHSSVLNNDVRMVFDRYNDQRAYATKNEVYRTNNLSDVAPTWTAITTVNRLIKAICPNPLDSNILYFVTSDSKVWRIDNACGASPIVTQISTTPTTTSLNASIAIINPDTQFIYLSCGNRMYRSDNSGASWTNISGILPLVNIIDIINDERAFDESVYIATARGVYYKNNTMSDWSKITRGLPSIADIRNVMLFDDGSVNRALRVSFFGRGIFTMPLQYVPTCATPTALNASLIGNSIRVTWAENVNTDIAYRRTQDAAWTIQPAGTTTSFLLNGLNGCDEYEIRIRKMCSVDSSLWSSSVFISTPDYPLPIIWTKHDIGPVGLTGSVCYDDIRKSYSVEGSGDDIWGRSDEYYFVHTPCVGNIEASCRVSYLENSYGWAKSGIMIRETLDPDSKHSMVCLTPGNGVANQYRINTGDNSGNENIDGIRTPVYIKIVRHSDTISTYYSFDELAWTFIYEDVFAMSDSAYVGLFSCSHENDNLHTAVFDKVKLSNHPTLQVKDLVSSNNSYWNVYPNPAKEKVTIELNGMQNQNVQIRLYNNTGSQIIQRTIQVLHTTEQLLLVLPNLAPGLYIMEVNNEFNKSYKKIIIN